MKRLKIICTIILSASIIVSIVGCKNTEKTESAIEEDWRKPANIEKTEKFVDKDGDFKYDAVDFNGPENYVIVYPFGNKKNEKMAERLKEYYKKNANADLSVITDKSAPAEKEILIGKTNRNESNVSMSESDLEVSLKGSKIVFSAGHDVVLDSAVEKFCRLEYQNGIVNTFKITTDFKDTVLDGYKYVWGDEFEGSDLDFSKWDFEDRMGGSGKVEVSWDKDTVDVNEGRLKLHALNYFNQTLESTRYKVPYSVVTKYKMNYTYGYAEIRARVPYYEGSWPSFWGLNIGGQGGIKSDGGVCYDASASSKKKYGVEIDIFEIFGSKSVVTPNAHKWYRPNNFDYDKIFGTTTENHTQLTSRTLFDWSKKDVDLKNLSNEYHTYGFEWTPKEMKFYVDGENYYSLDITKSFDLSNDMERFHEPIFLMFNNHVFADDMDWYQNVIDDHSVMPFCYYIDWFRLYQKPGVGELYLDDKINTYEGR